MLSVTGSINFDLINDDYYKIVKGNFEGKNAWIQEVAIQSYPIRNTTRIDGKLIITTKRGAVYEYPFSNVVFNADSPQHIRFFLRTETDSYSIPSLSSYLNFKR